MQPPYPKEAATAWLSLLSTFLGSMYNNSLSSKALIKSKVDGWTVQKLNSTSKSTVLITLPDSIRYT